MCIDDVAVCAYNYKNGRRDTVQTVLRVLSAYLGVCLCASRGRHESRVINSPTLGAGSKTSQRAMLCKVIGMGRYFHTPVAV